MAELDCLGLKKMLKMANLASAAGYVASDANSHWIRGIQQKVWKEHIDQGLAKHGYLLQSVITNM